MIPRSQPAFSVQRLQSCLTSVWVGREAHYHAVAGSTMDLARALAKGGAPAGTVVVADEQTAGRGRFGRRWIAPPGANLSFSILLFPSLAQLTSLSIVAPLAVVEGVRDFCALDCAVKWPNDVQVGGRKLAGVLLESELQGEAPACAIAGIGINVNFDPSVEPEIAGIATSILRETGRRFEREAVLAACLDAFERLYLAPVGDTRQRWRACLNMLGRRVRVTFQDRAEEGLAEDVAEDGSLILRRDDGSRLVLLAGEVSLRA